MEQTSSTMSLDRRTIVKLKPVVPFAILDHFIRRKEDQERVIGALLGHRRMGEVEIVSCFAVPHEERNEEEVAVGKDFFKQMYDLHRKSCPKEEIVGWYATTVKGKHINYGSCLIDEFFGAECEDPVHLVLDTSLAGDKLGVKAYAASGMILAGRSVAAEFKELPLETQLVGKERLGVEQMVRQSEESKSGASQESKQSPFRDADLLEQSMTELLNMLDTVTNYVDGVVAGKVEPNLEWGRLIASTIAAVPRINPVDFSRMFNSNLKDLLMVAYLSNLTRAQLAISTKLQKSLEA